MKPQTFLTQRIQLLGDSPDRRPLALGAIRKREPVEA
jgi:hypothetical protein